MFAWNSTPKLQLLLKPIGNINGVILSTTFTLDDVLLGLNDIGSDLLLSNDLISDSVLYKHTVVKHEDDIEEVHLDDCLSQQVVVSGMRNRHKKLYRTNPEKAVFKHNCRFLRQQRRLIKGTLRQVGLEYVTENFCYNKKRL